MFDNKALTAEETQNLQEDIAYMRTNYGEEYANRWVANDSTSGELAAHEKSWIIEYYNRKRHYISPQGFTTFKWVNNAKVTEDSIYDSFLHVGYQDAVLLFDTAAIRQAKQLEKPLLIPSLDGKVAFTPENITITAYKDHKVEVQYSGYIFSKEE